MSSNLREKRSAVILLAGGQSLRMGGVDKLWLELDGRPIIDFSFDWILDREFVFESGLSQVVVVISEEGYKNSFRTWLLIRRHIQMWNLDVLHRAGRGKNL